MNGKKLKSVLLALLLSATANIAFAGSNTFDDGAIAFIKGDTAKAYTIWKPLADNGNAEAEYHLGYMYQTGTGVPESKSKALYWYQLAAKHGHRKSVILAQVLKRELAH